MGRDDIPLDKAELLSLVMEALLYGFSLLMFGGTIWTLLFRRSSDRVNRKMLMVACALLLCSTAHVIIHIIRVVDGLILDRDTYPGGPIAFFSDISQWTFNYKNGIYVVQTLIGDGVVLYRCYVVWQSKLVMILPVLLWWSAGVTGFMSCYASSMARRSGVFGGAVSKWITSFWATSLSTNLLATLLLVCRLWYIDRRAAKLRGIYQESQLRPILHTIIDAGAIYSFTLLVALICFKIETNGQFVVLDMVTPIISITFYMVIFRVGLTSQTNRATSFPIGNSMDQSMNAERRQKVHVRITSLTESSVDYGRRSPVDPTYPVVARKNIPGDIELGAVGGSGEECTQTCPSSSH